jgi:hypothetical protein
MFNTLSAWLISLHHFYRLNEKYRAVARHIEQGKPFKSFHTSYFEAPTK